MSADRTAVADCGPATAARLPGVLRRNWLFAIFFGVGLVMRVLTQLAYRPALLYIDSFAYLNNLKSLPFDNLHPVGYELILIPLLAIGKPFGASLTVAVAIQHLLGLAMAVVLYRIARGLGAHKIVAAVITLPMLLDAYQLQIEQTIMSEPWSQAILLAAVWALLAWKFRRRTAADQATELPLDQPARFGPRPWQAAIAGALVAANVPIRTVGITVVIGLVVYLFVAGARWRERDWWAAMVKRMIAGLAGFAIILGSYAVAFRIDSGHWGLSGATSGVLYGRAATVAVCDELDLDSSLRQLCPKVPVSQREDVDYYNNLSQTRVDPLPAGQSQSSMRRAFGLAVLEQQPVDIVRAILKDFVKGFAWTKTTTGKDVPVSRWQFQTDYPRWENTDANAMTQRWDGTDPQVNTALAHFLRAYQLHGGYTPGTLLAVAGLFGIAGMFWRRGGLRAESMVVVGFGLLMVGGADAYLFSWRYQLPGLIFFPLAGAIGFTALTKRAEPGPDPATEQDG